MELEKRIYELQDQVYRQYSLTKKLENLDEFYFYLKDKLRDLRYKLESMDVNIKELDKQSIIHIWYNLFTSKGKLISKIEHDYKIYVALYDFIYSERIELNSKLEKIDIYKKEYEELIKEKEELLLESEKETIEKKDQLNTESIKYKNRVRDINEAINAGNHLNGALKYLVDLLNKTKDWDSFDIFGRGLFLSLTNSPVFKRTEERVKKLHYLANKFTRELKVINFYMDFTIDIRDIIQFVDYYENELYDDIKDKARILNTVEYINRGYQKIDNVIELLKLSKEKYIKKLIQIEKDKQEMMQN
ncbi:hypothetical protein KHQ81_07980 [Mycoplasmatota bacterium]|nr:hypothetical protein KHQ81_07980 [Mycoplasmatota bacterium]